MHRQLNSPPAAKSGNQFSFSGYAQSAEPRESALVLQKQGQTNADRQSTPQLQSEAGQHRGSAGDYVVMTMP